MRAVRSFIRRPSRTGRRINDSVGPHIARKTVQQIIHAGRNVKGARVNMLGLTFKENCPDVRNSKVMLDPTLFCKEGLRVCNPMQFDLQKHRSRPKEYAFIQDFRDRVGARVRIPSEPMREAA